MAESHQQGYARISKMTTEIRRVDRAIGRRFEGAPELLTVLTTPRAATRMGHVDGILREPAAVVVETGVPMSTAVARLAKVLADRPESSLRPAGHQTAV